MHSVRVLFIATLASTASWAVTDAQAQNAVKQAQNAIKLFDATPMTEGALCAPPGCDVVRDRVVFDEATLVLSCRARPTAVLSSTADGHGRLVVDNCFE